MQVADIEKEILQLVDDYFNADIVSFGKELEQKFHIFEQLDEIEDLRTKALGNFLHSIGLSMLAAQLQYYKIYETRLNVNEKAHEKVKVAYEYFKETNELQILEHILDHMIFLLWQQIPFTMVIIDEKLKLFQELIELCKKQEEIVEQLGDDAFLTKEERIPYRYIIGEFRILLEKANLSKQEAIDSNEQLKKKILELENFDFPKAKFWANKWRYRYACDIEGNKKISYHGGSLVVDGNEIAFSNDSYNRTINFKMYIEPEMRILEQSAYPDTKVLRTKYFYTRIVPKIYRRYEDGLELDIILDRPTKSKGSTFIRDTFSITPKKYEDKDYVLVIETTGSVDAQEHATLITERDVTLRINDPALEVSTENGVSTIKFNLIKKITEAKGPKSAIPEKEEQEYLGYGRSLNFNLYCNINPTFSGTFVFTDPTNWKYCLSAPLYMNKLKYKQDWYPNFLNFDYSPILFLQDGQIPPKFFDKLDDGTFRGFLKDIGAEFPGMLNHIIILGEFMADSPLAERRAKLLDLLYMMASITHLAIDEKSAINIITSNKHYYEEMLPLEDQLNKINEKLTRIYKSKTATAIKIEYIKDTEFISDIITDNKKIYDQEYSEVYLVENPILAFMLIPLVKYTQSAILTKDELNSKKAKKILTKAKQIWAIGSFEDVKIPKKATTKLTNIDNEDIQQDIQKINEIFKQKITEDYAKYEASDFLQRIYPGYTAEDFLHNTILTSIQNADYSYLTIASNYAANKPSTMNVIVDDVAFDNNVKDILSLMRDLRFTADKEINREAIEKIGETIKDALHPVVQEGLQNNESIIIVSNIPIPFELYNLPVNGKNAPLCISKAIGRVCSTDIIDTSIMLTLNMLRRMVAKTGENVLIIAPKYEGDYALPGATQEAVILARELKKIFEDKVTKKIDEIIDKDWIFSKLHEPLKIIHFSGHGAFIEKKSCLIISTPTDGDPVFLFADDLETLVETKGAIEGYPLVFTSACITGQIQESGSGLEGLAAQFIKSGATCFIGTLWEIIDESAREFATSLYRSLNQVDKQIGKIMLESRKKLHETIVSLKDGDFFDPTCFAFIFFGDPTIKIK